MLGPSKGFEAEAALNIELLALPPCHAIRAGNLIFGDSALYL